LDKSSNSALWPGDFHRDGFISMEGTGWAQVRVWERMIEIIGGGGIGFCYCG